MKLLLLLLLSFNMYSQEFRFEKWVEQISIDLIQGGDLTKYNIDKLPKELNVNFIFVDKAVLKGFNDTIFTLEIDQGKGKYCKELDFRYKKLSQNFYLKFSDIYISEILGELSTWINPWMKLREKC